MVFNTVLEDFGEVFERVLRGFVLGIFFLGSFFFYTI